MIEDLDYTNYPVLIVDDETDVLNSMISFFEDMFTIHGTDDPEKALTMVKEKTRPCIVKFIADEASLHCICIALWYLYTIYWDMKDCFRWNVGFTAKGENVTIKKMEFPDITRERKRMGYN